MLPPLTSSPDLAQLSDTEVVERIESALRTLESIEARKTSAWESFRRFCGLSPRWPPTSEPTARIQLALGEIRDLTYELERRVARDKGQRA